MSGVEVTVHYLDDGTNHFADLVVEEGLTLEVEFYKLDGFGVFTGSYLESFLIYVHILIST